MSERERERERQRERGEREGEREKNPRYCNEPEGSEMKHWHNYPGRDPLLRVQVQDSACRGGGGDF